MQSSAPIRTGQVLAGACVLSFLAAAVNVHVLLRSGVSVSHLTGDLSRLAGDLAEQERTPWGDVGRLVIVLACFVTGAGVSGYLLHSARVSVSRPYGRLTMWVGLALVVAWLAEDQVQGVAYGLAAMACGMQNGMATRYRGMVLRTTHVTGLFTDMGQMLGMRLSGAKVERWRLFVHASIAATFLLGAVAGAGLSRYCASHALLCWGVAYVLGGAVWFVLKRRHPRLVETDGTGV